MKRLGASRVLMNSSLFFSSPAWMEVRYPVLVFRCVWRCVFRLERGGEYMRHALCGMKGYIYMIDTLGRYMAWLGRYTR